MPAPKKTSTPHNKLLVLIFIISLFTLAITALNLKRAHDLVTTPTPLAGVILPTDTVSMKENTFFVEPVSMVLPADTYKTQSAYYYNSNSYSLTEGETGYSLSGSVSMYSKDPSVFSTPESKSPIHSVAISYGGITSDFSEGREGTSMDIASLSESFKSGGIPGALQKIGEISFDGGVAYVMKGLESCDDFCLYPEGTYYAFMEVPENPYGFGALVFEYPGDRALTPFQEYLSKLRFVR